MLEPDTRQTLLDALRPPDGFKLAEAVGTTYSLSLETALTAPAAFAVHAAVATEGAGVEPLALLDSIRRHARRFTIFFHAGQATVPSQRKLFAYLEGAVVPVVAPLGGVFHPKLWVLRFDHDDGSAAYRMLCASRNLTHDRSWDTLLRLDSVVSGPAAAPGDAGSIDSGGLSDFLRSLPGLAVGALSDERAGQVATLAHDIETVRWALPSGVDSGRFIPLGLDDGPSALPFPSSAERMAVVSPFVTSGLLAKLPRSDGRRVLVSMPHEIASSAATVRKCFTEVYALDPDASAAGSSDGASSQSTEGATGSDTAPVAGRPTEDPSVPFDGLHAKVFVFDHGSRSTVLTGSANATTAAFSTNVEFITELEGPRTLFGVDALLGNSDGVQTLRDFLVPLPVDDHLQELSRDDFSSDPVDELRRTLAQLPFEASATPSSAADRFRLEFCTATIPDLPAGCTWSCWPITLTEDAAHRVEADRAVSETFEVSMEGITAFLATEVELKGTKTRFVIVADLVEAPDDRESKLLRALLGNRDRFLRYLLMLLSDGTIGDFGIGDAFDVLEGNGSASSRGPGDLIPLLESMLRSLVRDPRRLDQIQELIEGLASDPDASSILPDGLVDVWTPIWEAAAETAR